MSNKSIVLFDMDGTLTPPRKEADEAMVQSLIELSKYHDIGILTGSDLEYVMQQLPQLDNLASLSAGNIDILPCNGTKRYTFSKKNGFQQNSAVNMVDTLGRVLYNKILSICCEWQCEIMKDHPDLPYTGTFVQYRGSLLNWCPIGRNAKGPERLEWEQRDSTSDIRKKYQKRLQDLLAANDTKVNVALGGSTSFDIYPEGWDKTYGLRHYPDHECYFVGDRCKPGGNDWHIYEELRETGRSYETTGPGQTITIIKDLISRASKN